MMLECYVCCCVMLECSVWYCGAIMECYVCCCVMLDKLFCAMLECVLMFAVRMCAAVLCKNVCCYVSIESMLLCNVGMVCVLLYDDRMP